MKCPACGHLNDTATRCIQCGADLTVVQSLGDVKEALRRILRANDDVTRSLDDLTQRLSALESQLEAKPPASTGGAPESPSEPTTGRLLDAIEDAAPQDTAELPRKTDIPGFEPPPTTRKPESAGPHSAQSDPSVASEKRQTWREHLKWRSPREFFDEAPPGSSPQSALSDDAEVRLGQKWLLIVGLAITVLAVGYFLKYSFDRNWIGPTGRVLLAYTGGAIFLGAGEMFRRAGLRTFGLYMFGGGIAVLYFAGYAAFQIYHLIDQPLAFGSMVLVTALAGAMAIVFDTRWLAVLGIIGGFTTPIVLSTGSDNQIALMTYMAILNGGIFAISAFKQWNLLNYLGLFFTWAIFAAWFDRHYAESKFWTTTVFINLFFIIYAVAPYLHYFIKKKGGNTSGMLIGFTNAAMAFAYSFETIRKYAQTEWVAAVTLSYAALFLSMGLYLSHRDKKFSDAVVFLIAKAGMFLVITVPILFSEHWITIGWALQGAAFVWIATRVHHRYLREGGIYLMFAAYAKFVLYDYHFNLGLQKTVSFADGYADTAIERWMTAVVLIGVFFWSARLVLRSGDAPPRQSVANPNHLYVSCGLLAFVFMNIETSAFTFDHVPRARFASISVLWAVFASVMMVGGFVRNNSVLRRTAIGLFAVTILKVFAVDMSRVDTPYRILSFLILGLLLVAASFLYHRFKSRIIDLAADHEQAG